MAILLLAWLGPLPAMARHAFAAHMGMHLLVVAVAAPLLAAGVARSGLDPVHRWPAAFPALPATVVEFLVVWAWHAPALHQAARQSWAMQALEQGSFLVAGLLVWLSAFGGRGDERAATGVAALLVTSMHMTLLGVLLAGASRPLYAHHGPQPLAVALQDQQAGGVLMLAVGGVAYLAGALVLLAGLLRDRGRVDA